MKYATFDAEGVLGQRLIKGIHTIPADAVPVDDALFARLVQEQDGIWMIGESGVIEKRRRPVVVPDYAQIERAWRDSELRATEWLVARHRDELDLPRETTLSGQQYVDLLTFRQALRDWPTAGDFPEQSHRPEPPEWLKALL